MRLQTQEMTQAMWEENTAQACLNGCTGAGIDDLELLQYSDDIPVRAKMQVTVIKAADHGAAKLQLHLIHRRNQIGELTFTSRISEKNGSQQAPAAHASGSATRRHER